MSVITMSIRTSLCGGDIPDYGSQSLSWDWCVKAHRLAKRLGSAEVWSNFRSTRNRAVGALRRSKEQYFDSLLRKLSSVKQFWSAFHSIFGSIAILHPCSLMAQWMPYLQPRRLLYSMLTLHPSSLYPLSPQLHLICRAMYLISGVYEPGCSAAKWDLVLHRAQTEFQPRWSKGCASSICAPLAAHFNWSLDEGS